MSKPAKTGRHIIAFAVMLGFGCSRNQEVTGIQRNPGTIPSAPPSPTTVEQPSSKIEVKPVEDDSRRSISADGRTVAELEKSNEERRERIRFLKGEVDALQRQRFTRLQDSDNHSLGDHIYNGIIDMSRIGESMAALKKAEPTLRGYAAWSYVNWTEEYLSQLQSLAAAGLDPETTGKVMEQAASREPSSPEDLEVQKAMLPVLQAHLTEFKANRRAPTAYTNDILAAYQTVTNAINRLVTRGVSAP